MLTLLQLQYVWRLEMLNSLTLWSRFCGIDGGNRTEGPGVPHLRLQPCMKNNLSCAPTEGAVQGERFFFFPKSKVRFTPKRSICWSESMREWYIVATLRLWLGLLNSNDPEIVKRSHFDDKCCSVIVQKVQAVGQQIPHNHIIWQHLTSEGGCFVCIKVL